MKRWTRLFIGLSAIWLLSACTVTADPAPSPEDPVYVPLVSNVSQYSFFVAGHTYGVPGIDNPGLHPPFEALFPKINSNRFSFGVFTGDIVVSSTPTDWDDVDEDVAELQFPVHFAVGNHDMANRELFVSRYGPTYFSFEYGTDLMVVLDGELDPCNIVGEQMTFLRDVLAGSDARNVFVFVHKLIWVTEGTPFYVLQRGINSSTGYNFNGNFWSAVEPLLRELDAQVYVIAGDVGVTWAMPLFYERYENIHLIASGMGGSEEENYLSFEVYPDRVQATAQRLDGQPLEHGTIEDYDLEFYSGSLGGE